MRTRRWVTAMAASAAAISAGCESPRPPSASRPQDFSVHVLVIPPTEDRRPPAPAPAAPGERTFAGLAQPRPEDDLALPRWSRPSSYVLEPGGRLRAGFGPAVLEGRFPPIARQLWPAEEDAVYDAVLASGLLELDAPGRISSLEAYEAPASHGGIALFDIGADGWTRVQRVDFGEGEAAERARAVVDRLAAMVWQPE